MIHTAAKNNATEEKTLTDQSLSITSDASSSQTSNGAVHYRTRQRTNSGNGNRGNAMGDTVISFDDRNHGHEPGQNQDDHDSDQELEDADVRLLLNPSNVKKSSITALKGKHRSSNAENVSQLRWLLSLAKVELHLIIAASITMMLSSGINLAMPAFAGKIVDSISTSEKAAENLDNLVLALFALAIITGVISFLRTYCISLAGERVVQRLRRMLFANVLRQDIGFFDVSKTGELLNRLSSDTKALELAVTLNIERLFRHALEISGCVCILMYTSFKLFLLMLIIVPFVAVGAVLYSRFVQGLGREHQDALALASNVAEESISNIRTVRALGQEGKQNQFYNTHIGHSFQNAKRLALANSFNVGGTIFIGTMAIVIVLWYGGVLVLKKEMSVGVLTSFLLYTFFIAYSLSALSQTYFDVLRALGVAERVEFLVNRKPTIVSSGHVPGARVIDNVRGRIEFKDVEFTYPSRPNQMVLRRLNLELRPGEVLALVGPSGGGKSTIANLILRYYDPDTGSVSMDEVNLKDLDPEWIRNHVAIVSQEPVLFATSIRDNIAYAVENATMSNIIASSKEANAHDFITSFPNGYDTLVGERGHQLSGGQKQRISIARALLQQPKILLLDEATSALDAESEHLVKRALDRLMKGRTVLIIAHRLSTVQNADRVCVVSEGRINEQGTHSQLMEANGAYKRLVERQLFQGDGEP